jgi:hypothetical protein
MIWLAANWWWLSWVLSLFVIPAGLGALKVAALKTKTVHDDHIVTLLIAWWSASRSIFKKK